MEEYKTSQYQCDREYYINIIRTVLESICLCLKIRDTSIISTLYVLPYKASAHALALSTVSASAFAFDSLAFLVFSAFSFI